LALDSISEKKRALTHVLAACTGAEVIKRWILSFAALNGQSQSVTQA
jgi:hypothetical protein